MNVDLCKLWEKNFFFFFLSYCNLHENHSAFLTHSKIFHFEIFSRNFMFFIQILKRTNSNGYWGWQILSCIFYGNNFSLISLLFDMCFALHFSLLQWDGNLLRILFVIWEICVFTVAIVSSNVFGVIIVLLMLHYEQSCV